MCGMHSFWVQFGHQREGERKRGQVCVCRRVGWGGGLQGSGCLFSRPLFESIVFRQLRFFMRGTIWRVLSGCRAAAVFWRASFMDHRPGVGWWIQTHPPTLLLITHHHPYLLQFLILAPKNHPSHWKPSHTMPDEEWHSRTWREQESVVIVRKPPLGHPGYRPSARTTLSWGVWGSLRQTQTLKAY